MRCSRCQRVCWFHICKALCNRHILNGAKPVYIAKTDPLWAVCRVFTVSRSRRFYISCICVCSGHLSPFHLLLCSFISYILCFFFFLTLCCIHTFFSLIVLIFHLIAFASCHIPPDEAPPAGMCHHLPICSLLSFWWWWWGLKDGARGAVPVTLPFCFSCHCFPPPPYARLCCWLTHRNNPSARSGRVSSVVTRPLCHSCPVQGSP